VIHGTEAHSALPNLGHSAIYDAALFIDRVKSLAAQLEQEGNQAFAPPFTTLNLGTIHGGTAKEHYSRGVPDAAGMETDPRRSAGSRRA
jgi:acetylornithine deacetylase/succinyl-diaminopimelate desuccinylase-like protein